VIRVPGCKLRGPEFDSRHYKIFRLSLGLERGPLNLVRINEELLERKVAAPVWKTEINDRVGISEEIHLRASTGCHSDSVTYFYM
jgi:hypothetical protein